MNDSPVFAYVWNGHMLQARDGCDAFGAKPARHLHAVLPYIDVAF